MLAANSLQQPFARRQPIRLGGSRSHVSLEAVLPRPFPSAQDPTALWPVPLGLEGLHPHCGSASPQNICFPALSSRFLLELGPAKTPKAARFIHQDPLCAWPGVRAGTPAAIRAGRLGWVLDLPRLPSAGTRLSQWTFPSWGCCLRRQGAMILPGEPGKSRVELSCQRCVCVVQRDSGFPSHVWAGQPRTQAVVVFPQPRPQGPCIS